MEPNPFSDEQPPAPEAEPAPASSASKEPAPDAPDEKPDSRRRWWVGALVLTLAFAAGFLPMWVKAGRHADERDAARREVKLLQIEAVAASAAMDARRGEYEPARQSASWLFTTLNAEFEQGPASSLTPAQQAALKPLLANRDTLITLLARGDPASTGRLAEIYLACRAALRGN